MKKLTYDGTSYLVDKTKSALELLNRKIIFIGDEYGFSHTDSDIDWVRLTAERMGIPYCDCFNWSATGACFLSPVTGLSWNEIINNNYPSMSQIAYKITDVVIAGGINDATLMYSGEGRSLTPTLRAAAETAITNIKTKFPFAKVWLAPIGWCRGVVDRRQIMCTDVFLAYSMAAYNTGAIYIESAEYVLHNYGLMREDYYTPNNEGQMAIADIMSSALMGQPKIISTYTKNGNNQPFAYTNMNFVKTTSLTLNDGDDVNLLSYMDGRTCFLYCNLTSISGNPGIIPNGVAFTLGTVSAGHFAAWFTNTGHTGAYDGGNAGFTAYGIVKRSSANIYTNAICYFWFEEPSNTPMIGGTLNFRCAITALDPTTSSHEWLTVGDTVFGMNMRNLSMPASLC